MKLLNTIIVTAMTSIIGTIMSLSYWHRHTVTGTGTKAYATVIRITRTFTIDTSISVRRAKTAAAAVR
jgi:hypothetical protein